jgi:hypothetical protein
MPNFPLDNNRKLQYSYRILQCTHTGNRNPKVRNIVEVKGENSKKIMTATGSPRAGQIQALLAENGYEVSQPAPESFQIRETESGVAVHAVLEGDVLFLSLVCTTVPRAVVTAEIMRKMLAADNGISTSSFQLYEAGGGNVAVTLNNFCKLQDMGPEDQDDVLSCVHFLLVDVMSARRLLSGMAA